MLLPNFLVRIIIFPFANLLYRIRVEGSQNVPPEGPVLLVSNHVSFIDAFLITVANQRRTRFMMLRAYYDLPVLNWLFKSMGCIPISEADSPKAMMESFENARAILKSGEVLCIFAEGEISRHGQMLRFKKGFEKVVEGLPIPIIPVHLDHVWGSIFSFEGGRAIFKRPRRIPYPVTVSFGQALSSMATAFEVRQAIMELGAAVFAYRLAKKRPLPIAFLHQAKHHPLRLAVVDSLGSKLNYGQTLARAYMLGRALEAALGTEQTVGVLLPPSAPGALVNIGLSMMGRLPANLNYTASQEVISTCILKVSIKHVVTSRKFLEKLGWEPPEGTLFLEDVAAGISKARGIITALALLGLPSFFVERFFFQKMRIPLDHLATIVFTSGSTGTPKGVMLTHSNILSNIEAVNQVYQLTSQDRLLGILPFFHAFGFTATLWLPLITGMRAIYHYNPLEAKRIGDLAQEHGASILLCTPTMLLAFLRRVEAEKFKSLRLVFVGAEKLREETAAAFQEKFAVLPLEGYGCTELSPVAAVNIPDIDWPGVRQKGTKLGSIGQPLPGVFIKVVDPQSREALPANTQGLILVKGPNVMKGYLGDEKKTAECLQDGYYATNDIGAMDSDGFVTITDRLSRFSKIAGEMVPHILIEEKLHALIGAVDQTFVVTSIPDEKRGERLIVLYRELDDLDSLYQKLQQSDLPKLWIPDKKNFHKVAQFPILGSGKLDMQTLKAAAKEFA